MRKINLSYKLIRTNDKKICHLQVIKSLIPNPQENKKKKIDPRFFTLVFNASECYEDLKEH